jgi:Gnt-I system high-affinity gluconate transporter
MTLVILLAGIVLLLLLITVAKLNAYISLIVASLFVGLANGMNSVKLVASITNGIGNTLGSLILILGFGVMLGALLIETGAAERISRGLVRVFGFKYIKLALLITGFSVGIALFYNAGFIVLIPLVFSIAATTKQPLVYLTIAMASALSVTHGFLPPHPGPTAIAVIFHADIGKTLLYGIVVAIPALIIAGLIFPSFVKNIQANPPKGMFEKRERESHNLPSFQLSLFTALIPVLLMAMASIIDLMGYKKTTAYFLIKFVGDPNIAMLIAVIVAILLLGVARGKDMKTLMEKSTYSLGAVAIIILVTAAGGAFKQVLIDSGTGTAISDYFKTSSLSPLVLGWLIATTIRIAIGSATVAGLTAAGIVQPLVSAMHVKPELMVLSIGAGSLMCSHVNDTGFWMFKEYLGLSLADTFRSWTVMETIVGVVGLLGVVALNMVV